MKPYRLHHDDDEWFDGIQIDVVPRFKTSGLSGDEWRVSTRLRLLRKGKVVYERCFGTVRAAVAFLPGELIAVRESGLEMPSFEDNCDQPGCSEMATVTYRVKARYCQPLGEAHPFQPDQDYRRRFCLRHAVRGDAALEDADDNYELIEGDLSEAGAEPQDESPATFGGVITLEAPE